MEGKTPSFSRTEQVQILMPEHINGYQRLFGGKLMEWIDVTAAVAARRHAGRNVTTAAVDNLCFKAAAYVDSTMVLVGQVTYVGRTSMEVRVDSYVEALSGEREMVNRAYLVMVALDENQRPTPVPPLIPETYEERQEYEAGRRRAALRRQRQNENF
ncbi:MAG: acyl-CoA thioesterase [Provencibacterium sp.]|jgi:acyl-CoA hydrolase|nr:acyl-CoA thioesterase [Provencibacterium sp.]